MIFCTVDATLLRVPRSCVCSWITVDSLFTQTLGVSLVASSSSTGNLAHQGPAEQGRAWKREELSRRGEYCRVVLSWRPPRRPRGAAPAAAAGGAAGAAGAGRGLLEFLNFKSNFRWPELDAGHWGIASWTVGPRGRSSLVPPSALRGQNYKLGRNRSETFPNKVKTDAAQSSGQ